MTIIIRDYIKLRNEGKLDDDEVESLIVDVVDASFYVSGTQGTFTQPAFVSPLLFGREHEIAALMQELAAEGKDNVLELWNAQKPERTVVPDSSNVHDIGNGTDWNRVVGRSLSEDNLGFFFERSGRKTGNRERWHRNLTHRKRYELVREWPPSPTRQRHRADTELSWPFSEMPSLEMQRSETVIDLTAVTDKYLRLRGLHPENDEVPPTEKHDG